MSNRDFYVTPKSNAAMRFFWKAAGGDRYLLERATYSDQVKYLCLGGIVVATGAMAALAGGYAFYTIFSPRGAAIDSIRQKYAAVGQDMVSKMTQEALDSLHTQEILVPILSILFGVLWGLIIFNIDRFIVTSTGKGDGTEAITWDEFKGAIPRILMGAIIAITISKPVEIRMFKTEIDNKLYEKQLELQKEFENKTTANFEERLKVVESDLGKVGSERNDLNERIKNAEKEYIDQLNGRVPGSIPGDGKLAGALKGKLDDLTRQLERFDQINADKIKEADKKRKEILLMKEEALAKNVEVANGLDGLLERIKLSGEVAGPIITLFITLLFLAIELTPVFFKLMLIKTPYDYLAENRDELIKADKGIEVKYDYYKDKVGQERHLIIHHEAERLVYEKMKLSEIQKELTDYALQKYLEKEKNMIDQNPDAYIRKTDESFPFGYQTPMNSINSTADENIISENIDDVIATAPNDDQTENKAS